MSLFTRSGQQAPQAPAAQQDKELAALQRFITRQPILDAKDNVVGYELKRQDRAPLEVLPGAQNMQQVHDEFLLVSVIDLDYQQALSNKLTFLSVAPATLLNPLVDELPQDKVVLSVTPGPRLDPEIVVRAEALRQKGLTLALDDVGDATLNSPLLALSQYIRLDTTQYDVMALSERVALLQRGHRHQLIAAQVDTPEVFETCAKLGFGLFQGYYFTQVEPAKPARMDANVMRVMELLNKVLERAEFNELEAIFKLDPALSYKLLRYINSPAIGLRSTIKSLSHALTLLGYDQTYRWLTLLLFSSVRAAARNQALLRAALARAHFTEALGKAHTDPALRGGLFITGMFSLLDALLNVPMSQALANLNLPEPITNALVHADGPYAPYLALAMACERFDQDSIANLATNLGLEADTVNLAHVNALIWSESVDV
jgi:EAL and modified HD-GYP domain-containing signal transduction protein